MKYMEGIFFSEEIDSLSNVLERDYFNRCHRKRIWLRVVERQTANETSEQTKDREHVSRDHVGRDHVATTHRLTRSSSEAIRQPTSSGTIRHLFCSVV